MFTSSRTAGLLAAAIAIGGCALATTSDLRRDRREAASNAPADEGYVPGSSTDDDEGSPFPARPENAGPLERATVETESGPMEFGYRMVGGDAISEGDVVLPIGPQYTQSATSLGRHWPNALVPYVIDANLPSADRVTSAIAHWESKTKLRFVPRTTERDYLHFRSYNACSAFIGQQGGRQFVNLNTSESASSVASVAIDRTKDPQRVHWFFKRGYATTGSVKSANSITSHYRYLSAPGKSSSNLLGVAFASNGHSFGWYNDGTVSEGDHADLSREKPGEPYVLAPGKTFEDVVGLAIDDSDKAYAFYSDGTFSTGTVTDLGATSVGQAYAVADGKTPADIVQITIERGGAFRAFYHDTQPHPDGGAPVIKSLSSSLGTATNLAETSGATFTKTTFPGHCSLGATIHEIGHAIGLFHEQTRHDRNQYVKIMWENIDPEDQFNFEKHSRVVGTDVGPYDFGSVMHYGPRAFSKNGNDTIVRVDGEPYEEQRTGLSDIDVQGVNAMYP